MLLVWSQFAFNNNANRLLIMKHTLSKSRDFLHYTAMLSWRHEVKNVTPAISHSPKPHEQNKVLKLLLFRNLSVFEPDADH